MTESTDAPPARQMLWGTAMELLAIEFPQVDRAKLEEVFMTCKWQLKKGDPVTRLLDEARRALTKPLAEV